MKHINEWITDYLDGSLPIIKREQVKSHLVFCAQCRELVRDIENLIRELKETPQVKPPKYLEARILERLSMEDEKNKNESIKRGFDFRVLFRWGGLVAAAALVLIVVDKFPKQKNVIYEPVKVDSKNDHNLNERSAHYQKLAPGVVKEKKNPAISPKAEGSERGSAEALSARPNSIDPPSKVNDFFQTQARRDGDELHQGITPNKNVDLLSPTRPMVLSGKKEPSMFTGTDCQVLSSQLALEQFSAVKSVPPLPRVDFSQNDLVFISVGEAPSAGYSIVVDNVSIQRNSQSESSIRVVSYRLVPPADGMLSPMVITEPTTFYTVPKFSGPTRCQRINP